MQKIEHKRKHFATARACVNLNESISNCTIANIISASFEIDAQLIKTLVHLMTVS